MHSFKWIMAGVFLWTGIATAQAADLLTPDPAVQNLPVISADAQESGLSTEKEVVTAQSLGDTNPLSAATDPLLPDWLFPDGATVTGDPVVWDGTTLTIPSGTTVNVTGRFALSEHSAEIKNIQVSGVLAHAFIESDSPIFTVSGSGTLIDCGVTSGIINTNSTGTLSGTGGTITTGSTGTTGGIITTSGSVGIINTNPDAGGDRTITGSGSILTGGIITTDGTFNIPSGGSVITGGTTTTGGTINIIGDGSTIDGTFTTIGTFVLPFLRELPAGTNWERQTISESLKGMITNILGGQKASQKRMRAEAQKMVDFLEQSMTGLGSLNTANVEIIVKKKPDSRQTDIIKIINRDGKFAELRIEYGSTSVAPVDVKFSSGSILRNNERVAVADIKKYLNLYANSADMSAAKDALAKLSKGDPITGSFYFWSPVPAASYMDFTSTVRKGKTTVQKTLRVWGDGHVSYTEATMTTGPILHLRP